MRRALWRVWLQLNSQRGISGQEMVEYALLAGFLVVSVAAVVPYQVTTPISSIFSKVQTFLTGWANG